MRVSLRRGGVGERRGESEGGRGVEGVRRRGVVRGGVWSFRIIIRTTYLSLHSPISFIYDRLLIEYPVHNILFLTIGILIYP